ncbi:MAG: galactokinase family protein [Lachnospiraceae bacterium]|nr:galactokinase family protein [Lachnospiraceae bacterium]
MNRDEIKQRIEENAFLPAFEQLYGTKKEVLTAQKERYRKAIERFTELYPQREELSVFSAPGRTEIGGNHTDHQHGCVLAAAVQLDAIAVVSFHEEGVIRIYSEGYGSFAVELSDLSVQNNEKGSKAIVRGIISRFAEMGVKVGGFDAYTTSDVLAGSGISSSAAFETLIGTIIDRHYNEDRAGAVEIAKIGQYAENVYFGKKCGLMDQMASSVGGLVFIDFADTEKPVIEPFSFDFEQAGYCICVTDTGGNHVNLTPDYVAVRSEMEEVAAQFGKEYLRQISEEEFYKELPKLRKSCSARAVLRAAHFFGDNRRAREEAEALRAGDRETFLSLVQESGDSSANLLQNLYSTSAPKEQGISLGIMVSKRILGKKGAVRVHGGGFAGTIQAFVPLEMTDTYVRELERIFGNGSCYVFRIRPVGGVEVTAGV